MEMRCIIKLYKYENSNGSFSKLAELTTYEDINMSAKQLFEKVMADKEEFLKNNFFIMEVNSSDDISDIHNFYSIRTDINSKISEIEIAGPNNLDKPMLIDAIIGRKPRLKDTELVKRGLAYESTLDPEIKWVTDIKERLEKMNVLRLKEIYEKLKS